MLHFFAGHNGVSLFGFICESQAKECGQTNVENTF